MVATPQQKTVIFCLILKITIHKLMEMKIIGVRGYPHVLYGLFWSGFLNIFSRV